MDAAQLYRMLVFANVVEQGSLTAAADELGISRSMVSQHLKKLETRCETLLIHRTTRKMALTEDGQSFYHYCAELLQLAKQAENATKPQDKELQGSIKISVPVCLGEQNLIRLIGKFNKSYPKIRITLLLEDKRLNLHENNIDIAIQTEPATESEFTSIRLGQFDEYLIASPEYVELHGSALHPDMLTKHQWIMQASNYLPKSHQLQNSFGDKFKIKINPFVSCNSKHGIVKLVKQGLGIAILPNYLIQEQLDKGTLVHILPDYHLGKGTIYAVHPFDDVTPPRVRAFLNFIEKRLLP